MDIFEGTSKGFRDKQSEPRLSRLTGSALQAIGLDEAAKSITNTPSDSSKRLLEDTLIVALASENGGSNLEFRNRRRDTDVAGFAEQNCKRQRDNIARVLGQDEAERRTRCDTRPPEAISQSPFLTQRNTEGLFAKDLPKSRSGTYIGSLRRHGSDPYYRASGFNELITKDREDARVLSAVGNSAAAIFTFAGASRVIDLNAKASIDRNWDVIRNSISSWNSRLGRVERLPQSQFDLELKYRSLLNHPRASELGFVDRLPAVYREDGRVMAEARAARLNGLKVIGGGLIGNVAFDQLFFKDSQTSGRTALSDAISYGVVLLPGVNKLAKPIRIAAIVGLHAFNRYLDWEEQH